MNRTIQYTITEKDSGLRIEQFLRRRGYSGQNLAEIKRMPKSILVNGVHYYMRQILTAGDILQVIICETKNSEKIPPVEIPLRIKKRFRMEKRKNHGQKQHRQQMMMHL